MSTLLTVGGRTIQLDATVGSGSTSFVFRAHDVATAEHFVLKAARRAQDASVFRNEAERHAWVCCPEINPLLAFGYANCAASPTNGAEGAIGGGVPLLLFPWLDGAPLGSAPVAGAASAQIRATQTLQVAWDLGRALDELHGLGLAHGDIKPGNVLLTRSGSARLLDLGQSGEAAQWLPSGGTPRYFAPETFAGENRGEARARDLFALGLLLAEIAEPELAKSQNPLKTLNQKPLEAGLASLVEPLLRESPSARPSARWVWQRAGQRLGLLEAPEAVRSWRVRRARAAYLNARSAELRSVWGSNFEVDLSPVENEWLKEFLTLGHQVGVLPGFLKPTPHALRPLSAAGLWAFLLHLVGPVASDWPIGLLGAVPAVLERVVALLETTEPLALTFSMLQGTQASAPLARSEFAGNVGSTDEIVELTLALASETQSLYALARAESLISEGKAPPTLLGLVARRLRLSGQFGQALVLLQGSRAPGHQIFLAETYRRARDFPSARASLTGLQAEGAARAPSEEAQLKATLARMLLDEGEPENALNLLVDAPQLSVVWETRALIEAALGRASLALESASRAKATARDAEEQARAEAVLGLVAHQLGDFELELQSFRRASEHAARAGAVIEEAHYLTGVAAASVQVGAYEDAQKSAIRARLLFDWAGRGGSAARAMQAEVAVFAALGAIDEAEGCAADAERRAKLTGDAQCRAYIHLTLADIARVGRSGREHAERAQQLLGAAISEADQVRVAARALRHGAPLDIRAVDVLARSCAAVDAAFEWWGARAVQAEKATDSSASASVIAELLALSTIRAAAGVRGPALAAGAQLASVLGDGEAARRLFAAAGEAARQVIRLAPTSLVARVEAIPWVARCQAAREQTLLPEQLSDVEGLVRALGGREDLRLQFERILDMLVLWTGVERALLLLPAPNGKLIVRSARNLARTDLKGLQLELSRSLAQRALDEGQPVVAVDAQYDLPEAHASVHALKLRSVLAVPLISHGQKLGVVYLDDRIKRGAFGPQELGWVGVIASLAAVALADTRAQLLLRRSLRRAARAEARVRATLGQREAELDAAQRELALARKGRSTRYAYDAIVGESEAIVSMLSLIDRVAGADIPVLIVGESGSGKELVARALHVNSPRANGPFVSENCSAIPETLLESALFGHVRGAFTGATSTRPGLFDAADGGTLFLDEIAEMSLGMQTKLLRVLEDGLVKPVGSERTRKVNVRVLGATHRDLEEWVSSGRFRKDLYYRLNVLTLKVPALRERSGDVILLIKHFIKQYSTDRPRRLSRGAEAALLSYSWPGNVRQLQNEIRRALLMADDTIELEHLSPPIIGAAPGDAARVDSVNLKVRVDAMERQLVGLALERTSGNQTRAAEMLGVSRFGLQKMLKRLEIDAKG